MRFLFSFLFCYFVALSFISSQCNQSPDIIFYNGNILTMDENNPQVSAIAIKGEVILAIGNDNSILSLAEDGCKTNRINLNGLTLMPGFNDAHCHWLSWREHICSTPSHEFVEYPGLEEIMDTLSMNGWTSISELNFGRPDFIRDHLENSIDLETRGELSVRINAYWGTYDAEDLISVLNDYGYFSGQDISPRIRSIGVKMYIDDPFGTSDILSQEETTQLILKAHQEGWQVAAHAVNVSAIEKFLNAVENALGSDSNFESRHRIEHGVKITDDQLNRIKNKDILISFQLLGPPDWPDQETFQTYISNSNTEFVLRWRDLLEEGVYTVGSTDAPFNNSVCDYSPFKAIYQAVTRKGYLDRPHADWELNQRITIEQALRLMTYDAAFSTKEEHRKGKLKEGYWADLIVLSGDPNAVEIPEQLLEIENVLTMVGAEVEFCNEEYPGFCQDVISSAIQIESEDQVIIFPNPTAGKIQLNLSLLNETSVNMYLLNPKGDVIRRFSNRYLTKGQTTLQLDLSQLQISPGPYILRMEKGGKVSNFPFIYSK